MTDLFNNLFTFEMANNHQGSLEHGLAIIREMAKIARRFEIRASVKLQYRDLDTFIHPDFRDRDDVKHIPRFLSTALSESDFRQMVDTIKGEGMLAMVTPFDEVSVARALAHGVDILKVASCSATDWPLLKEIASAGRPTIISTGGIGLRNIDRVVAFFEHRDGEFALLHCIGRYPAPDETLQMDFIDRLRSRYPGVVIGYSGHEPPDNVDVVKIAVSKGAAILERHVGLPTDEITLNAYSMNPHQAAAWVESALSTLRICGSSGEKHVSQDEVDSLQTLKRGVFAKHEIKEGEQIAGEDVFFAMPCEETQLSSGEFGRYRAKYAASCTYKQGEPIFERSEIDEVSLARDYVHEAKGMLREAHIEVGTDVEIEVSHHEGIENFRRVGCVLINVVNRKYCKKLVIVFPGQQHPSHAHKLKEETFQLLWGDLEVVMDGAQKNLQPGDIMLVEPQQLHSFRSRHGAIFEEVSTTHERKDSFYEDDRITQMDTLERKTIIQDW